jgi:hypothetical protein
MNIAHIMNPNNKVITMKTTIPNKSDLNTYAQTANQKLTGIMVALLFAAIAISSSGNVFAANMQTPAAQLKAEKNARMAADVALSVGLAAEQAARQSADTNEVSARQQAIQKIQDAINALRTQLNAVAMPTPPTVNERTNKGVLTLNLCPNSDIPQWEPCLYAIGSPGPAGGIVFYVTDGGAHGIEAAPNDQGDAPWGCAGTPITGAENNKVGLGKKNTDAILAGCNETGIAAKIASAYALNGHTDWFLPSIDELNLMSDNIGPAAPSPMTNAGKFTDRGFYWSSSELQVGRAWAWQFSTTGNTVQQLNYIRYLIRPVRYF